MLQLLGLDKSWSLYLHTKFVKAHSINYRVLLYAVNLCKTCRVKMTCMPCELEFKRRRRKKGNKVVPSRVSDCSSHFSFSLSFSFLSLSLDQSISLLHSQVDNTSRGGGEAMANLILPSTYSTGTLPPPTEGKKRRVKEMLLPRLGLEGVDPIPCRWGSTPNFNIINYFLIFY